MGFQLPTSTGEFTGFLNHQQYQPSFFRGTWGDSMTAFCLRVWIYVSSYWWNPTCRMSKCLQHPLVSSSKILTWYIVSKNSLFFQNGWFFLENPMIWGYPYPYFWKHLYLDGFSFFSVLNAWPLWHKKSSIPKQATKDSTVAWTPGSSGLRESIRFLVQHQMVQASGLVGISFWAPTSYKWGYNHTYRGYSSYRGDSSAYNW